MKKDTHTVSLDLKFTNGQPCEYKDVPWFNERGFIMKTYNKSVYVPMLREKKSFFDRTRDYHYITWTVIDNTPYWRVSWLNISKLFRVDEYTSYSLGFEMAYDYLVKLLNTDWDLIKTLAVVKYCPESKCDILLLPNIEARKDEPKVYTKILGEKVTATEKMAAITSWTMRYAEVCDEEVKKRVKWGRLRFAKRSIRSERL